MSRAHSFLAIALTIALSSPALAQQVVYTHNFDSAAGWPDSDVNGDLTAVYTVVGSEYLINPLKNMAYALAPAPVASSSADMVVQSDVRMAASQAQSRAGIACRVDNDHSFYAFNMIAGGSYEIVRVRAGDAQVLASGSLDFDPYDGARLKAVCRGARLSFYANDQLLGEANDNALVAGLGAGLLSVSPVVAATNAAFDNFALASFGGAPGGKVTASMEPAPQPVHDPANGAGDGGSGGETPMIDEMALYADNGSGKPGPMRSLFEAGHQRVYLVMEMERPVPANFRAQWIAVRGSEESTVLNGKFDSPGRDRRVWLYADRDWTPGLYRVDLYANGELLDQREFSVS
jgi:hypothetical protein